MAKSLYPAKSLRNAVFGFKNDTGQDRALIPALTGNTELVRMTVVRVCNDV